ncbi:MAG: hypothetical protein M3M97_04360 [Actinomycetota bacterium]|nr:hypothetical protein [Actinomycetota bacterium]
MTEAKPGGPRPVGPEVASDKSGFADSWVHAVLAFIGTSRWSRLLGYGFLIVVCRVVRTIIRA